MATSVFITGAAGYIGSVLVQRLLNRGFKVTAFDNFTFGQTSLLGSISKELTIVNGDVRDVQLMKSLVSSHDIIIPLAAIVGAPACDKNHDLATAVNLEQAKTINSCMSKDQKILFPVTNSGYGIGEQGKFCDETSPLRPISHYGRTKVEAEALLLDAGNAVTFRLATVFGASPRMRTDLLVNDFVLRAVRDRYLVLFEAHFKRNYIHVRDVCNAFELAIGKYDQMRGEPYNVGLSDANLSKRELCDAIQRHVEGVVIVENEFAKDKDQRNYIVSNEKIESMGFVPEFGIDDGIQELLKVYSFLQTNPHQNV